jgi:bla regulator protein blaR1
MLAWMSYVIAVSLLLGLAALALEHAARTRQKSTRWVWAIGMIASLLLPMVMSSRVAQITPLARGVEGAIRQCLVALGHITASGPSPSGWLPATAGGFEASPDLDRLLQAGWGAASIILFATILAGSVELSRRRRRWECGALAGVPVHFSADAGPAVVGLLNPQIVVPRWVMQCPPPMQEMIIAHEQSHLDAQDARLLAIALGLVVCLPWNLPLWWQLRRLRLAVEIDCDARVLRRGYEVSQYGETLIAVGERQSAAIATATAMAKPRSLLERRIRNMLKGEARYPRATAVALTCLGTAFAAGAAGISPPTNDDAGRPASQPRAVKIATFDGDVGFYQMNNNRNGEQTFDGDVGSYQMNNNRNGEQTFDGDVGFYQMNNNRNGEQTFDGDVGFYQMHNNRNGEQLNAQFTGQSSVPVFARSTNKFSYKDKSISFVTAPDGHTTSLILHQYGLDMPMRRIDVATAQQIASLGAERRYRPRPEAAGRSDHPAVTHL